MVFCAESSQIHRPIQILHSWLCQQICNKSSWYTCTIIQAICVCIRQWQWWRRDTTGRNMKMTLRNESMNMMNGNNANLDKEASAPLGAIRASYPFDKIIWDTMGLLPLSEHGNRYILVVTRYLHSMGGTLPSSGHTTLAKILVDEVPISAVMSYKLYAPCWILDRTRTSAYHSMRNDSIEQVKQCCRKLWKKDSKIIFKRHS